MDEITNDLTLPNSRFGAWGRAQSIFDLFSATSSDFALGSSALEIRFRSSCFGATRYPMDVDRSTLRLPTGYPIETYF
jgi:hypothetical protein